MAAPTLEQEAPTGPSTTAPARPRTPSRPLVPRGESPVQQVRPVVAATDNEPEQADAVALSAPDHDGWAFLRWFGGALAVLLASVAAFNAYADTTGTLGTGLVDPVAEIPRDRAAKVTLIERAGDPDVVVLGTSRSKRLDPRLLGVGSTHPVNAAVVGADMFESRVLVDWLEERARRRRAALPQLVIGVDVEAFRGRSLRTSGLLAVPQLERIARRDAAGDDGWRDLAAQLPDLLLTWGSVRESWDSVRSRSELIAEAEARAAGKGKGGRTRSVDEFDAAGVPRGDRFWYEPARQRRIMAGLRASWGPSLAEYQGRYERMGTDLSADAVQDLRIVLRTARRHDRRPIVVLTPAHPELATALRPLGRDERRANVLALLRREEDAGHITLVDCSTCVSAAPVNWVDAVHVSPTGARRFNAAVRRALAARGVTA